MKFEAMHEEISESTILDSPAGGSGALDVLLLLSMSRKFIVLFTLAAALLTVIIVLIIPNE